MISEQTKDEIESRLRLLQDKAEDLQIEMQKISSEAFLLNKKLEEKDKCKNKPITEHGVECECGSILSNGERIYCYLHEPKPLALRLGSQITKENKRLSESKGKDGI